MPKIIVADTSCLILFEKINALNLLQKVYGQIYTTETVRTEYDHEVPGWIKVVPPATNVHKGLSAILDPGEATSISLAFEHENSLLIIDEIKGRKLARKMGVRITGTLGVLVAAKRKGYISAIRPVIDQIQQTNFRISEELIREVLKKVDEV